MDIISILASSVVTTTAVSAVVYFARNIIIQRLTGAIAHEYAVRLEHIRADLGRENAKTLEAMRAQATLQQSALAATFATLTATHMAGHERTLNAIEILWQEVRRISNWMPLYASRTDIFLPEEIPTAYRTDTAFRLSLEHADGHAEAIALTGDEPVEKARPFLGEYLYAIFFAYRAFAGRVAKLILDMHRKRDMRSWHEDLGIESILRSVLTEQEYNDVPLANPGRIQAVRQILERKMLEHIARILSGNASATFNLQQAREIIAVSSTS